MNRSKDRHLVAYCSSCREDRGRHTLRGSHSSSHDSRRRYLLDAEDRGMVPGGSDLSDAEDRGMVSGGA
jgi:hypothetical protein